MNFTFAMAFQEKGGEWRKISQNLRRKSRNGQKRNGKPGRMGAKAMYRAERTKPAEKISGKRIRAAAGTALKVAAGISLVIVAVMAVAVVQGTKVEDFRIGGQDE